MRIANIIGTRPQYIKLAAMHLSFRECDEILNIDTGQHYDYNMSSEFINTFNLRIHHKTMNIIEIKWILTKFKPDVVLLYGDTYSTLIGLIAARNFFKAHIEAGGRTHNRIYMEEIIRMAVDSSVDLCFAPSKVAFSNLLNEGRGFGGIWNSGDIVYDLLLKMDGLTDQNKPKGEYIYMTLHRSQTVGDKVRLQAIMDSIGRCGIPVIFPIHPRTKKMMGKFGTIIPFNIKLIEPCSYLQSLKYIKHAKCVVTDSGGIEREAYLLKTPGIILNDSISWPETMKYGWNRLVKADKIDEAIKTISNRKGWEPCYGDGNAGKIIMSILEKYTGAPK